MMPTTEIGVAIRSGHGSKNQRGTRHGPIKPLFERIFGWCDRARQRQALADLDERLLRDIGMDRGAAKNEFSKPFWR